MRYIIIYDLLDEDRGADYRRVERYLEDRDAQKILNTVWVLKSTESAASILDELKLAITGTITGKKDRIAVIPSRIKVEFWAVRRLITPKKRLN